ncbi:uncharacterized protein F4807DRAFT_263426 [Annulohypoxylon truncatum]|uniref:uncharacterized protein n=1 Tax=Annulohypoxylon truncatum TaxID=327061 RepID=UPI00200752AF|nr:uncharacterized protein F4807DRAFT_263426 [Annulohypoxylon truncatum]KAI1213384.1 hypothetical protein F4807DRAFT_263426 [Annulohypoxylon truncatum]
MAAIKTLRCASCDAEVLIDLHTCMICYDVPKYEDGERPDVYCNTLCQQNHSEAHKAQCQRRMNRQKLLRAASLMKATFLTFRECLYGRPLVQIKLHNNELHLHIYPTPPFNPWYYSFPEGVTADVKHKEAAISIENCNAAASICGLLASRLLEGIATKMELICVDVKPRILARYMTPSRNPDRPAETYPLHTVVVVDIQEEKWIIDMTGRQFGFPDVISPLKKYMKDWQGKRVKTDKLCPYPVGELDDIDHSNFFPFIPPVDRSADFLAHRAHEQTGRLHLKALIEKRFVDEKHPSFPADLLNRTEEAFQAGLGEWVAEVKEHMMDFVKRMTGKYNPTD